MRFFEAFTDEMGKIAQLKDVPVRKRPETGLERGQELNRLIKEHGSVAAGVKAYNEAWRNK